ncbi:BAG family molecular chaperone regulator Bag101 [Schizosaccharomyces japonicus yFS275]|uniref:BAG family molecular chaperone regulator Bag101 n=1 Tax=Schizosaccharomyces japonicus (strain yFS275 / FY16936) TaxID=402676 RepID=B6K7U5_SCHJY|nr:BAG family molecular chaperone regulator Bag101 [Schizosaccharomyces japonicus yFS275]EEB09599.1 BAG family molecular chaperone regulator Bag101 [Schizosaccharomyces japonicus yFS275]
MPESKRAVVIIHYWDKRVPIEVNLNENMQHLYNLVAQALDIPETEVSLVFAGRRLTHMNEKLSKYGIKNKSKILCRKRHKKHHRSAQAEDDNEEATTEPVVDEKQQPSASSPVMKELQSITDHVDAELEPAVKTYIKSPPEVPKKRLERNIMLSELLLQQLFKLDAVETQGNPVMRTQRKATVTKIQDLLQQLDQNKPVGVHL